MRYKTLIAVMAIGFAASLSEAALSSDYQFHVRCNEAYRASQLPSQGCRFHRINYDHIAAGGLKLMCWHDVHCPDGRPFIAAGYRKGLIWNEDLRKLRRCKADPSRLDTSCAPLEYPYYASCGEEFSLSSAARVCELIHISQGGTGDRTFCSLTTRCKIWDYNAQGYAISYTTRWDGGSFLRSEVRHLESCNGRLRYGGC